MLPSHIGQRLMQCCRLLTRDNTWRNVNITSRYCRGRKLVFVNHLWMSTESRDVQESTSRTEASIKGTDITENEKRVNDAASHLQLKMQLENELKRCTNVSDVLNQLENFKLQPIHALIVLERLNQLQETDRETTQEEMPEALKAPLFGKVQEVLDRNISQLAPAMLLGCLSYLLNLSEEDIYLIKSLETQIMWLMRRFSISQVIRVLEMHSKHQETALRKQMYRDALSSVEKRWVEISSPKEVITLMYITLENSPKLSDKLEEKALELAEHMSPKELYRVAYILAKKHHRNTPLLRAIAYHLNKTKLGLSTVQLSNLLYSCSTLNVCDSNLLDKISTGLRQKASQETLNNPALLTSVLFSFGNLRWHSQVTLDTLMDLVKTNIDKFSARELATVPISAAKLNYSTPQIAPLLESIADRLSERSDLDEGLWLDVVWSMAVLNLLTSAQAASVLNPEFFLKLSGGDAFRTLTRHIKLLNIQAAAEYDLKNYAGPKLPQYADDKFVQALQRGDRTLAKSVLSVLNNMAPSNQYMKTNVVSKSGYFIDADIFVNLSGQPLVFSDFSDKDTAGVKRIAVRVLDFSDLTLNTRLPTGLHAMAARHITADGFTVIEVPYTEFEEKATTVQKVQYMQQKINMAIGKVVKETVKDSVPS